MSVIEAIGNTPMVELRTIWDQDKTGVRILAKLEGANPGGSIKDRPAYFMIKDAIESGHLNKGKIILEPTSGNTGIGMAMIAAALGFRIKLTMPACVSNERRSVLAALGAQIEVTPGCDKTDGAIHRAHKIVEANPNQYFMPNQFANESNWKAHYKTTAPEIAHDTKNQVDCFVAGMGTSGTLMGCARYFQEKLPTTRVIGVEPGLNHRVQGLKNMKESIIPEIFEPERLSHIVECSDENAFDQIRDLSVREGLFCGISSGAAVWGAMEIARDLPRGSTVVVILPDRGDRYLSTEVFRSICAECPP